MRCGSGGGGGGGGWVEGHNGGACTNRQAKAPPSTGCFRQLNLLMLGTWVSATALGECLMGKLWQCHDTQESIQCRQTGMSVLTAESPKTVLLLCQVRFAY